MKRFIQIAAVAAVLPLLFACGSSKKVAETPKSPEDEVRLYWINAPKGVLRGYGTYNDNEEWFAQKAASAIARSNIASEISGKIKGAVDIYKNKYAKQSYNSETIGRNDADTEKKDAIKITEVAEEILQGAKIVKYAAVKAPNGTYDVYVCAEVDSDVIAEYIANNKKIQNLITEDEKLEIDFNREQFKKEMQEEFDKYMQERGR